MFHHCILDSYEDLKILYLDKKITSTVIPSLCRINASMGSKTETITGLTFEKLR